MRKNIIAFITCLIIGSTSHGQEVFDRYQWTTLPCQGAPVARHEAAFVECDDLFYLIGGRRIQEVSIFNPETNSWSSGSKPPIELHHFQGLSYKGEILIFGAQSGPYPHEESLSTSYIYHPKKDQWRKGPQIPSERVRGASGVAIHNNKLYMACGIINGHWDGHVKWFDCYDFETNTWTQLPDAPRVRDHFQAVVCGDKLFLIGGRVTSGAENNTFHKTIPEIDVFDFETQKWFTLEQPVITQRAGCMAVLASGKILLVGGESGSQTDAHNEVECLDPETGTWSVLPSLNQGRHGTQLIWSHDKLYVASGCGRRGGNPELQTIERFAR